MITIILFAIGFVGGVYVGARYGEKLRGIWNSIFG
jgi:hypothetical protein